MEKTIHFDVDKSGISYLFVLLFVKDFEEILLIDRYTNLIMGTDGRKKLKIVRIPLVNFVSMLDHLEEEGYEVVLEIY